MNNIKTGTPLIEQWGVTVDDYNKGGFGNVTGQFKIYRSLLGAWTKQDPDWVPPTDEHNNPLPNQAPTMVVDIDRVFGEIALQYIEALYSTFEILRVLDFDKLMVSVQDRLRNGVYQAIQLAVYNRNVLEKVTNLSRSGGSISVNDGASSEIIPIDMFGLKGANTILNSGILGYDIVDTLDEAMVLTEHGNIIVGKFDETVIPDIDI